MLTKANVWVTCCVFSAPVGGGTGGQQTILHEEQ